MYDSFLYGYGLNLAISHKITSILPKSQTQYLFFNDFFYEFIADDGNSKIYKNFLKYFDLDADVIDMHNKTKAFLVSRKEEIFSLGFESWVSKYLLDKNSNVPSEIKFYVYALYNYWGNIIQTSILATQEVRLILEECANSISPKLNNNQQIFTTNFDFFLDTHLSPQHLHGKFALPLRNIEDIILPGSRTPENFEYTYLFGTNGLEKGLRLNKIKTLTQFQYQLGFLFDSMLDLGHLLIYGLSFGLNEFLTKETLKQYPKSENNYFVRSVDGHILLKLGERFQKEKLSKITMSYHTDEDLENLKYIISLTDLAPITEFKHSNEIFSL